MENPWGKIILGGLAAAATWNSLGPEGKRKAINVLEATLMTVEQVALALGQQRQQLALPPVPELEPESAPMPPPPQWLEEALRKHFPDYQSSDVAIPIVVAPLPEVETDARWRDVIVPPAVVLVLGKRDGGKSVLAYRLLELFRYRLSPYVVGAPATARQLLPDWIGIAPTLEELPNKTIAIIDEAYLAYHARESMTEESKAMSQALNLSRQREQVLIFVTQEARQLDKNIASAASVVVFKEPGMLQPEFERPELRKLVAEAAKAFSSISEDKQKWSYVYSPDAGFLGLLEGQLASFWKPSLSKLYAGQQAPAASRTAKTLTPEEKAQMARKLRDQDLSYSQIAQRLGVSKATVANYIKGYPYRRR